MKQLRWLFLLLYTTYAKAQTPEQELVRIGTEFDLLQDSIRDGTITKSRAVSRCMVLLPAITQAWKPFSKGDTSIAQAFRAFPVKGYDYHAIGGTNGSGYIAQGYNFFDGNRHKGHPAHDIFIRDINQNSLDDRDNRPVKVLTPMDGVVIAAEDSWDTASSLRGGKYISVYNPDLKVFCYFAHNSSVLVTPGQVVRAGDAIAEVGRTGYNAYKKRSPTHLHFSTFRLQALQIVPFDPYTLLKNCK